MRATMARSIGWGMVICGAGLFALADDCSVPPAAPSALRAAVEPSEAGFAQLSWTDNSSDEAGFRIEVRRFSTETSYSPMAEVGANVGACEDITPVSSCMGAQYRVCGFNACGLSEYAYYDYGVGASFDAPDDLMVTIRRVESDPNVASESFMATLTWQANAIDGQGFVIERRVHNSSVPGEDYACIGQVEASATQYEWPITGPQDVRVRTLLPGNRSAASPEILVQNAIPQNLSAYSSSPNAVHVSWSFDAWGVSGFVIERRNASDSSALWEQAGVALADTWSYDDVGVQNCMTYEYRVYADMNGTPSDYSRTVSVSVKDADPATPSDFNAQLVAGGVQLTWTDNSDDEDFFYLTRQPLPDGAIYTVEGGSANMTTLLDPVSMAGQSVKYSLYARKYCGSSPAVEVTVSDRDSDGMEDEWEAANGLNPLENDAQADADQDTRVNIDERARGTDPQVFDTLYAIRPACTFGAGEHGFGTMDYKHAFVGVEGSTFRNFVRVDGQRTDLPVNFESRAFFDAHTILGNMGGVDLQAQLWSDGMLQPLSVPGYTQSYALGMGKNGDVIFKVSNNFCEWFVYRWRQGVVTELAFPPLNTILLDKVLVNNEGVIFGKDGNSLTPFYYDETGFHLLETGSFSAYPVALNNHGQMLLGQEGGVLVAQAGVMDNMGTFKDGYWTEPQGISEAKQILCNTYKNETYTKGPLLLYEDGHVKTLESLVVDLELAPAVMQDARSMNSVGQIALFPYVPGGLQTAYILTPVNRDYDRDGLSDYDEYELETALDNPDTDGDGLTDGYEVNALSSDPLDAQSGMELFDERRVVDGAAQHSLVVRDDGSVWAWGDNSRGQLGDGTTVSRSAPVPVPGLANIVEVDGEQLHSVALNANGLVYAWGDNTYGDLGMGTSGNYMAQPQLMAGLPPMKHVAAGYYHNLGLAENGEVWAWGSGWEGELGVGNRGTGTTPVKLRLTNILAIAAGARHSMALKNDGTVWTWGRNDKGQIGDGTTVNAPYPVQVQGLPRAVAIADGNYFAMALCADGTVWAWGNNTNGQLGVGSTVNSPVPVQVQIPNQEAIVAIDAGYHMAMALTASGQLLVWGAGGNGQLGNNSTTDSLLPIPLQVGAGQPNPCPDANMTLGAGGWHNLLMGSDGAVYSWGVNHNGQLGYTTSFTHRQPVKKILSDDTDGDGMPDLWEAANGLNPLVNDAALDADADGINNLGELTLGTNPRAADTDGDGLTDATDPYPCAPRRVVAVSAGDCVSMFLMEDNVVVEKAGPCASQVGVPANYRREVQLPFSAPVADIACDTWGLRGYVLTPDGTVYSWKVPYDGVLSGAVLQALPGLPPCSAISAGFDCGAALSADGAVYTWTTDPETFAVGTPQLVMEGAVKVVAHESGFMAINQAGQVFAWGSNFSGLLGRFPSPSDYSAVPVLVGGLPPIRDIDAEYAHALAIDYSGNVWTWGSCTYGATLSISYIPTQVLGISNVRKVATGYTMYSLVLKEDGTLWAWGAVDGPEPITHPVPCQIQDQDLAQGAVDISVGAYLSGLAVMSDGTLCSVWGFADGAASRIYP